MLAYLALIWSANSCAETGVKKHEKFRWQFPADSIQSFDHTPI